MRDFLRLSAMVIGMFNMAPRRETYWSSRNTDATNDQVAPSKRRHRDKVKAARKQKHRSKK